MQHGRKRILVHRLFAGWFLAALATSLLLPMCASAAVQDCLKDVGGKSYAELHPLECAAACYLVLDPSKGATELAKNCGYCNAIVAKLALNLDASMKPVAAGLQTYTAYACVKSMADLALQEAKEALCDKGPLGCCISVEKEGQDGKGKIEKEECRGKRPVYYGDCYCIADAAVIPPDENKRGRYTYNSCEVDCKKKGGRVDVTQGIGRYQAESEGVYTEININPLCFKPDDCVLDGGDFAGFDTACPEGQGKCIVPEPVVTLSSPVLDQVSVTGIRGFVHLMFRFAVMAAIVAAALMFIYGGFKYILSSSFMEIGTAKETMVNGLVGMILTLTAVLLLNTVNPAASRYDKLSLYMVNKIQFATFNWCNDYQPARPGQPLRFSDSGDPPGQFLYEEGKWDVKGEDTICAKEYYIEGVVGQRCNGRKCEEKGKTCYPCREGIEECGEKQKGFACVKAVLAGTVTFSDGRAPKKVSVMSVCNWIQPAAGQKFNYDKVDDQVSIVSSAELSGSTSGRAGSAMFNWAATESDLAEMIEDCKDYGGLRGVMLGVIYTDTENATGMIAGATAGAAAGGVTGASIGLVIPLPGTMPIGGVVGTIVGAAGGAALGSVTVNDALVVSKKNCGQGGAGKYSGYATGGFSDDKDMKEAFYCGSWVSPGVGARANLTELVRPDSMWSQDELEKAIKGDEPILCDITLSNKSSPSNPSNTLMGGCRGSWPDGCPAVEPKCNE